MTLATAATPAKLINDEVEGGDGHVGYNNGGHAVDGTLFILGDPPRNCSCIVVQILISVEVRLFQ